MKGFGEWLQNLAEINTNQVWEQAEARKDSGNLSGITPAEYRTLCRSYTLKVAAKVCQ